MVGRVRPLFYLLTVLVLWEDNGPIHRAGGHTGGDVYLTIQGEVPTGTRKPAGSACDRKFFNNVEDISCSGWSCLSG